MEPTTQGTTASGMFGGSQQDDTIVVADTTQGTTASGMFGGSQQDDGAALAISESSTEAPVFSETQSAEQVVASEAVSPIDVIPAPTFVNSFADLAPVAEVTMEAPVAEVTMEAPVAEVTMEAPVAEVTMEAPVAEVTMEAPVAEVTMEAPVAEVTMEAPVAEVTTLQAPVMNTSTQVTSSELRTESTSMPLTIMTVNQEEQQLQSSQTPITASANKGIESLKQAPEFAGIDIDAIIAHTNPTGTGVTVASATAPTQIPTSSAFKKMAAIGGGLFVLAGAGLYVHSTMFSAGVITSDTIQADVQQTQDPVVDSGVAQEPTTIEAVLDGDVNSQATTDTTVEETTTEVSTTTQPSFGATDSGTDLIEQVGEPSNALVDTEGHIASLKEKIAIAETVIQNATTANQADAVKYGTFAITKYKGIIQKLENGGYASNKDVTDIIAKIDLFYNKAIDITNQ